MGLICTLVMAGWFTVYFIRARAIVEGFGEDKKKECAEKFQSMFMLHVVVLILTIILCLMSQMPMQWVIMELVFNLVVLMWEKHGLETVKAWGA
jgi:Na+/H+ antiporter NhaD/arsenite permease-like protein